MNDKRNQIILTIDTEPDKGGNGYENILNLERFLLYLQQEHVACTFFCTPCVAEKHPKVIRKIVRGGHEIGLHIHPQLMGKAVRRLNELAPIKQRELIEEGRLIFKNLGVDVVSFRSGGYNNNRDTMLLLEELGFVLDSSCFPRKQLDLGLQKPFRPIIEGRKLNLVECPISCARPGLIRIARRFASLKNAMIKINMFGVRMFPRNLVYYYFLILSERYFKYNPFLVQMIHSYDLVNPVFVNNLKRYIHFHKNKNRKFITIIDWLYDQSEFSSVKWE
jgi:peptidoglycan/xylan/chitin deacetylase (PgdA/CDA1 family)